MKEIINNYLEKVEELKKDFNKCLTVERNKSAAARARKLTLEIEKLGKDFRKKSLAEFTSK